MEKFFGNLSAAFASEKELSDNAGFIDEILFIVGIALAAVAISSWIGGAAMNKGADIASCIEGQNVKAGASQNGYCKGTSTHAKTKGKSITNEKSYKDRFGVITLNLGA